MHMNKNLPRIITIAVIVFALITALFWYFTKNASEDVAQTTQITGDALADAEKSVSCLDEPIVLENGRERYPIDPKYGNLEFLGQLFTAYNCEPNRSDELFGVTDGDYTSGSYLWLKDNPDQELISVLQDIGYKCATEDADDECMEWELLDVVSVEKMMRLEPFYEEFKQDDCRHCG